MSTVVKKRRRRLTAGELRDLLQLLKMRLALAIDVDDLLENSQQVYEICAKIRAVREELKRRELKENKSE